MHAGARRGKVVSGGQTNLAIIKLAQRESRETRAREKCSNEGAPKGDPGCLFCASRPVLGTKGEKVQTPRGVRRATSCTLQGAQCAVVFRTRADIISIR
jgi:hypothetical protein